MKKIQLILLTSVIIILILFSHSDEILNLPMKIIVRDDQPKAGADYALLMMGNVTDRTPHAVKLIKNGVAKRVIFAEAEEGISARLGFRMLDGQATFQYLKKLGLHDDQIIFLDKSRNTSSKEEVDYILKHIEGNDPKAKRVIMVTSWYHSSRATWILNKINTTQLRIESSPSPAPKTWWAKEGDFLSIFNEYLKWLYYLIHY